MESPPTSKVIKIKWLIYTVAIGLLPFIIRFLMFIVSESRDLNFLMNESDFIILGLVLNITNINELQNKQADLWKIRVIGLTLLQIAIYSGLLALSYLTEIPDQKMINSDSLFICSLFLSFCSLIFSYAIYTKLSNQEIEKPNDENIQTKKTNNTKILNNE